MKQPDAWPLFVDEVSASPERAVRLVRAVGALGSSHGPGMLNEALAELIRRDKFSSLPSRLFCSFAMRSRDEAFAYSARHQKGQHVFEVVPVGMTTAWSADIDLITRGIDVARPPKEAMTTLGAQLTRYWETMVRDSSNAPSGWEVLVAGSLKVIGPCLTPR